MLHAFRGGKGLKQVGVARHLRGRVTPNGRQFDAVELLLVLDPAGPDLCEDLVNQRHDAFEPPEN